MVALLPAGSDAGVRSRTKRRAAPIVIAPEAVKEARSPEPRSRRASATEGVSSPRISGARLLRTSSDGAVTMTSACRENSSSAWDSGCAAIWKFRVGSAFGVSRACATAMARVAMAATTIRIAVRMRRLAGYWRARSTMSPFGCRSATSGSAACSVSIIPSTCDARNDVVTRKPVSCTSAMTIWLRAYRFASATTSRSSALS